MQRNKSICLVGELYWKCNKVLITTFIHEGILLWGGVNQKLILVDIGEGPK